jgi:hypothetical protein
VPSSGGKDSHYQVLKLQELGAHVTVVTATTCHLTDIGRRNIDNLARYAKTIEVSPNKRVRAILNRLGLQLVGDISWPEHVSIFTTPFKVACDIKIPLLFYGENPQTEYGGPQGSDEARQMTRRWVSEFGGFLGMRPSDMVGMEGITARDMADYMPPSEQAIKDGGIEAHFLGQYLPWNPHHNAAMAVNAGMKYPGYISSANFWEWENLDNAQTGIHDYFMFKKYGYGRGCAQICVDVRSGYVDRESAIDWVSQYDGAYPENYMGVPIDDVLNNIGMTRQELYECERKFSAC